MVMKHLHFGPKMSGNHRVEFVLGNGIDCAVEFYDIEITDVSASDPVRCNLIDYLEWGIISCGV
jgi:hypothetical protein